MNAQFNRVSDSRKAINMKNLRKSVD